MSWSSRRALLVLAAVAVLGAASVVPHVYGQRAPRRPPAADTPPAPGAPGAPGKKEGFDLGSLTLPKDEDLTELIDFIGDSIKRRDWDRAITSLQEKLLGRIEDVWVPRESSGREVYVSAKTEAARLLASLPKDGRVAYESKYGEKAEGMYKQARTNNDALLMGQVVGLYFYTEAGPKAADWLGTYMLDRGEFNNAARYFHQLLHRSEARDLPDKTLMKAAFAFKQVGDKNSREAAIKELARRNAEIKLRDKVASVSDLEAYLDKLVTTSVTFSADDSLEYRGRPNRNAILNGGVPFLEPSWKQKMVRTPQAGEPLKKAEGLLATKNKPILSDFVPVTVTVTKGEKKVPLVVYRSYWGIHAVNLRNGKLEWDSPSDWSFDRVLGASPRDHDSQKSGAFNQWLLYFLQPTGRPDILFENSLLGTLSSDGKYVYAVEDLALPPPPNQIFAGRVPPGGVSHYGPKVTAAIRTSKLQAFSLTTGGKLDWEVGGEDEKGDLADTYFLGAPLAVNNKLYVLTEKLQEIRLVCLDPAAKGKVLSSQLLATTKNVKLSDDPLRRTQAAHLAFAEGILVIPTNAGAVFGVDLLSNSLVWAYPYREKGAAAPAAPAPGMGAPGGVVIGPGGRIRGGVAPTSLESHWKTTAPAIQDGKVVFTAPDGKSIHCVNLRDGLPVWTQSRREDDLYMAGVFNGKVVVVGKIKTRALTLAKGDLLWELDTGLPSGQGAASALKPGETSDIIYYLPVKESVSTHEPEICAINVDKGIIHAHTKSRKKEVPGNLLFYEGDVLSQSYQEVVAYPQLEVKLAKMNEVLKTKPKDPDFLTERGDYLLDKGDLGGAIADFRKALANGPKPQTKAKARAKLYEALTEYLQRDFNAAEDYLKEYEELCKVDLEGSTGTERTARIQEERRRRANFLCLVGKGREAQNRLVDAFEKYLELGEEAKKDELIQVVDEPSVKAAPDVWSQGRIAAMVKNAKDPKQKKALEDQITARWKKLQDSKNPSLADLRKFVSLFGSLFGVGKEARLALAERLMEDTDLNSLLEAEQQLSLLRAPQEDPQIAARAVEALARLNTRKGLLDDAAYYYRLLGQKYPKVVVADGKTGKDFLDDLLTDKRFLLYLDGPSGFNTRGKIRVNVKEERGSFGASQVFEFAQSGEPLPFFERNRIGLRMATGNDQLRMMDAGSNEERWSLPLTKTQFQQIATGNGQPHRVKFTYQNLGHLVVLQLGHMVFGIDPLNKGRVLWEKNLANPPGGPAYPAGYTSLSFDPRDDSVVVMYADGWVQRLGQAGPLQGGVICLQTRDSLTALDPITSHVRWTRSDVNSRTQVFGDDQYIYVVGLNDSGTAVGTRVFRAYDGVSVRVPDFANQYDKRVRMIGRNILTSETDLRGQLKVSVYDVLAGKAIWEEKFPAGSILCKSEHDRLAGVVEPSGDVRIIDVVAQKDVLKTKLDTPDHIAKAQGVYLVADSDNVYLGINGPTDPNLVPWGGGVQSNIAAGTGLRSVPVNGEFYAFDRASGKRLWHVPVKNEMLVLARFEELPIVLFTSRFMEFVGGGPARTNINVYQAQAFVKKNGKWAYDNRNVPPNMYFHDLSLDPRAGKVELTGYQLKVTFNVETVDK